MPFSFATATEAEVEVGAEAVGADWAGFLLPVRGLPVAQGAPPVPLPELIANDRWPKRWAFCAPTRKKQQENWNQERARERERDREEAQRIFAGDRQK